MTRGERLRTWHAPPGHGRALCRRPPPDPLKLGFILWLQLPSTQGATRIYMQFVQPQLKLHEGRIDGSLDQARSFATTSVQDIRQKGVATWGSEMLQRAKSSSAAGGSSAQQDNSAHVA